MLKVMVAEDDIFVADMLEDALTKSGYNVCGIARTVEEGLELAERHKPDLAVLDVRLAKGGLGTEIAARLNRLSGLGILYATGHIGSTALTKADGDAWLGKPYRPADFVRALKIVEEIVNTGEASRPFPDGFHILEYRKGPMPRSGKDSNEIQRLLRQQAALAKFGSFALGEGDLSKVLTEAARVCAECLGVPFCTVCRYRPEENDLLVEAGVGWKEGVIGRVVSQADESSPQGRAFSTGEPVICDDLNSDSTFVLPSYYTEHGIISTVHVIIKKEGQPYGVLEIDSPVQHDYDEYDIVFLTGFANILAEAVNTSKRNTVLQSAVERMKDMVADKDRLIVAKNRLLSEKIVLAQELQHRVRNNLQLVYGMLQKQLDIATKGPDKDGISAISCRVMTLAKVHDHLLGAGLSRTIDFGGYLSSLCSSFEDFNDLQQGRIELIWEPLILDLDTVTALGLVVAELISNSYLHAFSGGRGTIKVSLLAAQPGGEATIVFADNGAGYSESVKSKSHGLGLVKRLMEQVGGTAEFHSDHGATCILKFPVPMSPTVGAIIPEHRYRP